MSALLARQLSELTAQTRRVEASTTLSAAEKRQRIDDINARKEAAAKRLAGQR
jgi:hypothetical protein